jgi:hypothetical protein
VVLVQVKLLSFPAFLDFNPLDIIFAGSLASPELGRASRNEDICLILEFGQYFLYSYFV